MSTSAVSSPANPWVRILESLEMKVNRLSFDTWFKPTRFSHSTGNKIVVRVPTPEFKHIGDKYADLIQEAIDNLGMQYDDVEFMPAEPPSADPRSRFPVARAGSGASGGDRRPGGGVSAQTHFDWDGAAQLNPRYTFDAFVIGGGNQFAHAAALAVAE
ncbi:MAG: DnaA N-terminal domain-containing protein, partial [Terriglobales bacterium]